MARDARRSVGAVVKNLNGRAVLALEVVNRAIFVALSPSSQEEIMEKQTLETPKPAELKMQGLIELQKRLRLQRKVRVPRSRTFYVTKSFGSQLQNLIDYH